MSRSHLESIWESDVGRELAYHGSPTHGLTVLEPSQAYSRGRHDGAPAVFAANGFEPAIFVAVLGKRGIAGWNTRFYGHEDDPYGFYVAESSFEEAEVEGWNGLVYVVPRDGFEEAGMYTLRSRSPVAVREVVEVGMQDLAMQFITVIEDRELLG